MTAFLLTALYNLIILTIGIHRVVYLSFINREWIVGDAVASNNNLPERLPLWATPVCGAGSTALPL